MLEGNIREFDLEIDKDKGKGSFTVVSECTLDDLVAAVNKRINEGWSLRGDILVSGLRHYILYSQAMTRDYRE
jgi:hypothetical protein